MREAWKSILSAVREILYDFIDDDSFAQAAAVSFYTLFSMVPLMMIVVGIAGLVWGEEAAAGHLSSQLGQIVGPRAAELLETVIANAGRSEGGGLAVVVGVVALLVGATGAIAQLKAALDHMWEVPTDTRPGALWRYLKTRLLSVVVVLTAGVLLIVSFVASAFLATAQRVLERTMALPLSPVLEWTAQLVTMTGVTLLIVVVYRFLPSVRMSWPSIWVGAISTTFFFFLGRSAIAAYVSWSGVGSAFGATGSLVALMLWIYYTSLSLFLGAEVAQVWAKRSGKPIVPRFRSEPGAAVRDVPRQADAPKPRESSHPGP